MAASFNAPVGIAAHRRGLQGFLDVPDPGVRLAVVTAPRRAGLSTRLAELIPDQQRFVVGRDLTITRDDGELVGAGGEAALDALAAATHAVAPTAPWVAIDGVDRLLASEPELPTRLAARLSQLTTSASQPALRWLLAGAAPLSLAPLWATDSPVAPWLDTVLRLAPDDHRQVLSELPDPGDLVAASRLYAIVGGIVGYRTGMVADDLPRSVADVDRWVAQRVLSPAAALHAEAAVLLAEDPSLRGVDPVLQHGVLSAIAAGATTAAAIGKAVGRPVSNLTPVLQRLIGAGYVQRDEDPIRRQRPTYGLAHALLHFHHAVIAPHRDRLQRGEPLELWQRRLRRVFNEQVRPAAFTAMVRRWLATDAAAAALPGARDHVGMSWLGTPVLVAADADRDPSARQVTAVAMIRAGARLLPRDLTELLAARARLGPRGAEARLLLCGADVSDRLEALAAERQDLEVVDLPRLMAGT